MRLAVDVMGGDHGPEELLQGVKLGLADQADISQLYIVGSEPVLRSSFNRIGLTDPRVRIHPASEVLTMEDKPVLGLRRKKDCSILRAVELVKSGEVDAVISSGNTGGIVAAATIRLRTLKGIERPAIACILPSINGAFVLIDGGANPDCTVENLLQFAAMGSVYSEAMLHVKRPRVGVLSNGSEDAKGTELTRATVARLRNTRLHVKGYCEGYDLFLDGVDVAVCDGFVGNIVLKTTESLSKCVSAMLKAELTATPLRKVGALLAKQGLDAIKHRMNPEIYGGAPLLGINGCVIKIHGSAKRTTLQYAMRQSVEFIRLQLNATMVAEVSAAMMAAPDPVGKSLPTLDVRAST